LSLINGEEVLGFIYGDAKGSFSAIKGKISAPGVVTLTLPENTNSGEIRYAWADNPVVNLINSVGLPAEPFRFTYE